VFWLRLIGRVNCGMPFVLLARILRVSSQRLVEGDVNKDWYSLGHLDFESILVVFVLHSDTPNKMYVKTK